MQKAGPSRLPRTPTGVRALLCRGFATSDRRARRGAFRFERKRRCNKRSCPGRLTDRRQSGNQSYRHGLSAKQLNRPRARAQALMAGVWESRLTRARGLSVRPRVAGTTLAQTPIKDDPESPTCVASSVSQPADIARQRGPAGIPGCSRARIPRHLRRAERARRPR